MQQVSINGARFAHCAFCVHWYDPTNSAIRPLAPKLGRWEFDNTKSCFCAIHKINKLARLSCPKFSRKL